MDIRQLRYFIAIVEEGSLSGASTQLKIAQPALSFHLRNMETELGTPLLFRTSRGVVPTDAGRTLMQHARRIVGQFAEAEREIRGAIAEPAGEVRLGLPGTISQMLSVPLISTAAVAYPNVKLRIAEAMSGFIGDWLREDRVDLAVLYLPERDRAFKSQPILREELCVLGSRQDKIERSVSQSPQLLIEEIVMLPLILPSPNHGLRELLERSARESGLTIATRIDVDSYSSIKKLVEQGLGFSVLPVNAVVDEVRSGRLRVWAIGAPGLTRDVHLVYPSNRPLSTAADAIQRLCRKVLVDLVHGRLWQGATVIDGA